jgi:hypothetical protein
MRLHLGHRSTPLTNSTTPVCRLTHLHCHGNVVRSLSSPHVGGQVKYCIYPSDMIRNREHLGSSLSRAAMFRSRYIVHDSLGPPGSWAGLDITLE